MSDTRHEALTVQQLIDSLQLVKNKNAKVVVNGEDYSYFLPSDVAAIIDVDDSVVDTEDTIYLQTYFPYTL